MPVTYSPYTNNIFVWYVADTFQTIVTTWASDCLLYTSCAAASVAVNCGIVPPLTLLFSAVAITLMAVSYTHLDVYKRQRSILTRDDHFAQVTFICL